jgi:hypothetical protein
MISTPIPKVHCNVCGYCMNQSTAAYGDDKPKSGDVSICANCGHIAVFDEQLNLREPTPEEQKELDSDQRIIHAQILIRGWPNKKC